MEKQGRVEVGKTPSVVSGKPSDMIKSGEALCSSESETFSDIERKLEDLKRTKKPK